MMGKSSQETRRQESARSYIGTAGKEDDRANNTRSVRIYVQEICLEQIPLASLRSASFLSFSALFSAFSLSLFSFFAADSSNPPGPYPPNVLPAPTAFFPAPPPLGAADPQPTSEVLSP
jgi:hypothetical protein